MQIVRTDAKGRANAISQAQRQWRDFPATYPKPHLYREGGYWFCEDVFRMSYGFGKDPATAWANRRSRKCK